MTYNYTTPVYAVASMNEPENLPQFRDQAAKIITHYVRKHSPRLKPTALNELFIRDLLCNEYLLKRKLEPKVRDYLIKVFLGIVKPDEQYERDILKLDNYTIH